MSHLVSSVGLPKGFKQDRTFIMPQLLNVWHGTLGPSFTTCKEYRYTGYRARSRRSFIRKHFTLFRQRAEANGLRSHFRLCMSSKGSVQHLRCDQKDGPTCRSVRQTSGPEDQQVFFHDSLKRANIANNIILVTTWIANVDYFEISGCKWLKNFNPLINRNLPFKI